MIPDPEKFSAERAVTSDDPAPPHSFPAPFTSEPAEIVEDVDQPAHKGGEEEIEDADEEDLSDEDEVEDAPSAIDEVLGEIRDEIAATSTENRRNTRRIFDALKQFGGVLDALAGTVNSLHATTRTQVAAPAARPGDSALELIELSDRVDRIAAALAREPAPVKAWWPPTRRALKVWLADRELLADSLSILVTHVRTLLKSAGVERISCMGNDFDPACMNAVEVILDRTVPDHTVLAELLPGWREAGSGRLVRAAQVRVTRSR